MVLQKMKNWCAYQERSQNETRQKLEDFLLDPNDRETIIADLIAENYLNEERFAIAFAGGKFRIKHWGRIKIRAELKRHRVSEYSVNKALEAIDADEYEAVIIKLIEKKEKLIKTNDLKKKWRSVLSYLISRGFESELASENLSKLHTQK